MKKIILTDEEYDVLVDELQSLYSYHWNDDRIHANDCGSKILPIIEEKLASEQLASERRRILGLDLAVKLETLLDKYA